MAKMMTPAIDLLEKRKNSGKAAKKITPGREAWRRLKRNRLAIVGMVILIIFILVAVFANFIAPAGIDDQDLTQRTQRPSAAHIMGTDKYGRDIFSRVVYGTRISIPISFACVIIAFAIGGVLGAIAAFYGGKVDNVIMRFMDIFQSIPPMLMAIAIAASLGPGVLNLILAISLSTAPARSRVVRAAILTVKSNDYVESATAIGASKKRPAAQVHAAQRLRAGFNDLHLQHRDGSADGILSELSWPRHPGAHSRVGCDAGRRTRVPSAVPAIS